VLNLVVPLTGSWEKGICSLLFGNWPPPHLYNINNAELLLTDQVSLVIQFHEHYCRLKSGDHKSLYENLTLRVQVELLLSTLQS